MFSKLKQAGKLIKEAAVEGLDEVQDKATDVFKTKYNLTCMVGDTPTVKLVDIDFEEVCKILKTNGWELSEV